MIFLRRFGSKSVPKKVSKAKWSRLIQRAKKRQTERLLSALRLMESQICQIFLVIVVRPCPGSTIANAITNSVRV
jgi:hypothetical protein